MKAVRLSIPLAVLAGLLLCQPGCKTTDSESPNRSRLWEKELGSVTDAPLNPEAAHKELNLKVDLIPKGKYGRRIFRELNPRYITIHSTQNPTGDAYDHAKALKRGALRGGVIGYLCWHFTVQDDTVIQHIPTDERGEHADFDGPGNRYSIGIEMCEHQGNDRAATLERTAKLAASLMYHHDIPVENIRAHYHWPREGYDKPHKNCPHFLLDDGRPGDDWRWFVSRVNRHLQRLEKFEETMREQQKRGDEKRRKRDMVQRIWDGVSRVFGIG